MRALLKSRWFGGLGKAVVLGTVLGGTLVAIDDGDFQMPQRAEMVMRLTPEEMQAEMAWQESWERLHRALCADHWAASQITRVQRETSAAARLCE